MAMTVTSEAIEAMIRDWRQERAANGRLLEHLAEHLHRETMRLRKQNESYAITLAELTGEVPADAPVGGRPYGGEAGSPHPAWADDPHR